MTFDELAKAAKNRKAVTPTTWPPKGRYGTSQFARHRRYQPAAWIFSLPGCVLHRLLPTLEIYDPNKHGRKAKEKS